MMKLRNESGNEPLVEVVATSGRRRSIHPALLTAGNAALSDVDQDVLERLEGLLVLHRGERLLAAKV